MRGRQHVAQLSDGRAPRSAQEPNLCVHQHLRPGDRPRRLPDDPALRPLRDELRQLAAGRGADLPGAGRSHERRDRRTGPAAGIARRRRGLARTRLSRDRGGHPRGRPGDEHHAERRSRFAGDDRGGGEFLPHPADPLHPRRPGPRARRHEQRRDQPNAGDHLVRRGRRGGTDDRRHAPRRALQPARERRLRGPSSQQPHELFDGPPDHR
jgi:hypothetical protein